MEEKKKRTLLIVSLAIVLALIFGISYAYFLAQDESGTQSITTAMMQLDVSPKDEVSIGSNLVPITLENFPTGAAKQTFTVTSRNSEPMNVKLSLELTELPDGLDNYDFKWALYEGTDNTGTKLNEGNFLGYRQDEEIELVRNEIYENNKSQQYTLYIWIEETNEIQNEMMNKTFKAKFKAEGDFDGYGVNLFDPSKVDTTGYYNINGELVSSTSLNNYMFEVIPGEIYEYTLTVQTPAVVYFDENKNLVTYKSESGYGTRTITIPNNVKYAALNFYISDIDYIKLYKVKEMIQKSGKIVALGDSITAGVISTSPLLESNFQYYVNIANKLNMKAYDYGKGGTLLSGTSDTSMVNRYQKMSDDADIIMVMGGINDFTTGTNAFGTIDDTTNETFYGSLNVLMEGLLEKYPNGKIIFITPLDAKSSLNDATNAVTGKTLDEYVEAIKLIAQKHDGINVIDLHNLAGKKLDPTDKNLFLDGIHPNHVGHKIMANIIYDEMIKQNIIAQ